MAVMHAKNALLHAYVNTHETTPNIMKGVVGYFDTVKPLIADSPRSGRPLYSRQISCPRLLFL